MSSDNDYDDKYNDYDDGYDYYDEFAYVCESDDDVLDEYEPNIPPQPIVPPKMVHVPGIHPNLYLADRSWISSHDGRSMATLGIDLLINLTLYPVEHQVPTLFFPVHEDKYLPYDDFQALMVKVGESLSHHLPHHKVVVYCDSGTNRSVCGIVTFDMMYHYRDPKTSVELIKKSKVNANYTWWDTLTNGMYRDYLQKMYLRMISK